MTLYCLQPEPGGHTLYEGDAIWSAISVGYLRQAHDCERNRGSAAWIVFDQLGRPFTGDSSEAALEAFSARPVMGDSVN